jgi:broad specificity phosphatase PhoE
MKLYITRHGESLANTLHTISNRNLPHPLTSYGRMQAEALASQLLDKGITHIFTSPILRAYETAEIVASKLNLTFNVADALREYDCGELEGRGDEKAWRQHEDYIVNWLAGHRRDKCPQGGENFNDIRNRFVPFIEELIKKSSNSDKNSLLVTHGGILLVGLPHVLANVDFKRARTLPLDNT